jgi:hypothetical protein
MTKPVKPWHPVPPPCKSEGCRRIAYRGGHCRECHVRARARLVRLGRATG